MADTGQPPSSSRRPRALINGFGHIGRLALRRALGAVGTASGARPAGAEPGFDVVAINDPHASAESAAYLLQFDSVQGSFGQASVTGDGAGITVTTPAGKTVDLAFSTSETLHDLPIRALGIDIVLECSGKFLSRAALQPALDAGARAVVVSAPIDERDGAPVLNVVYGVNHQQYDGDAVVTAASCTTNCLAPIVQVIHSAFTIQRGCITTIHDVTNTQTIVDALNTKKSDLRRARSGMTNLAPTSTGSAKAIGLVFPELRGKLNGLAVRVPLLNGSITDAVFVVATPTTVDAVNAALRDAAAGGPLAGVLGFETRPLVSADYTGDSRSAIVDAACTQVVDGVMVKIYAWYDNEWGYSCRYVDVANHVVEVGRGKKMW